MKAFALAKVRLAPALSAASRADLARSMAASVLRAAGTLPTAVVCDDTDVAAWAADHGAAVVWAPGRGLDGAVAEGVRTLTARGATRVIVAHADLPLADELAWVSRFPGVTVVPDRHDDGTNVICVPTEVGFPFAYGPGSFSRHAAASLALGLPLRVVREPRLGRDVDVLGDLEPAGLGRARAHRLMSAGS